MLILEGVRKNYGDFVALHPLNVAVEAGRTTVLIGPSGCGKSTTLRIINGLIEPDAGRVVFAGEPISRQNALAVRKKMGYVIQSGGLFPHLTTRQNVALMAQHFGWDEGTIAGRIRELRQLTHLADELLDRYPAQLSGGQKQRVSLMRALMLDPPLLLLDEPLGALDPLIRAELQADLRDIFRELKKTVVIVTHDMGEAAFLGDTIVLMRHGHVVQRGTIRDLLERPADPFVTQFINAQRNPMDELSATSVATAAATKNTIDATKNSAGETPAASVEGAQ